MPRQPSSGHFSTGDIAPLRRTALRLVATPKNHRTLVWMCLGLVIVGIVTLIVVPWQQTVVGSGRVTAFNPEARPQTVESVIAGRIVSWNVVEGARVHRGDTLCVLTDINVNFLDSNLMERLGTLRDRTLQAQESAISVAIQRRRQAEQRMEQAQARLGNIIAELSTARTRFARAEQLFGDDLVSRRDLETATLAVQKGVADSLSAAAAIVAARQDIDAFRNEEERVISQAQITIQEAEVRLANAGSRIGARVITAPINGVIARIMKPGSGQTIKEGEPLATIVPTVSDQAVEIMVSGMDAALVEPGRLVSLQFSGFPAFQFSGWQNISVGVFHGRVRVVDAVDDGTGRFRILVVPDTTYQPWPDGRFLRQGTDVTGWVLLDNVSIGYELWRRFMGFPPQFPVPITAAKATGPAPPAKEGKP